ncbi:hypothetical protein ACHAPJ_007013 [Fusarium lateritium]
MYGLWESQLAEDPTLAKVACSDIFREEGSFPDGPYIDSFDTWTLSLPLDGFS